MTALRVIWKSGDPWRLLTDEVEEAGSATIVSRSGNTRLVDLTKARHNRLPIEGGNVMPLDGDWRPLHHLEVSPCGVTLRGEIDWAMGTQLWLVLAGLVADWHLRGLGRSVIDAIANGARPETTNAHPQDPCCGVYCHRRRNAV